MTRVCSACLENGHFDNVLEEGALTEPTPFQLNHMHWMPIAHALPEKGVTKHFPNEAKRLRRLIEVQWPDGPICPRCGSSDPTRIEVRELFQCSVCRHQFSATSGTLLHRSRLALGVWFKATEELIRYHKSVSYSFHMPAHALAQALDIQYVTARRIRKIILDDIGPGGAGFLTRLVCVRMATASQPNMDESEHRLG